MPSDDQLASLDAWAQTTVNPVVVLNGDVAVAAPESACLLPCPAPPPSASNGVPVVVECPSPPLPLEPPPPPAPPESPSSTGIDEIQVPATPPCSTNSSNSSNSFNSCQSPQPQSVDWPRPLEEAAYHGLAGRIVRLIEPHTEADLGALLVQFLVAFGNVIGRTAHMTVEKTDHFFNLFATIVGDTAKARKGTSWNQIAGLFKRVDQEWCDKRIESGMSSGEGLIYAIRDPVFGQKTGSGKDANDEPELVLKDEGVEDKRLLLSEGEFAQCLKVMSREGNTLSPVIRVAWDGQKLNTLVKNNQVSCMEPHVSIIGHITREELSRLLSQSEMFNGLANRFLWVAATRSQLLPEGGRIEEVNFNNEIMELQTAIRFARTAGQVRWAESTRELWSAAYRNLSEAKPGILGSVTARSEAQVLRLSGIYALLAGSALIQPEHLQAAMAVWDYCDRSARWIFGTKTGNKNADKILTALRNAGPAGMTQTSISETVFKKNLPAHDLFEALSVLMQMGLVDCIRSPTEGATVTRWVLKGEQRN